MIEEILYLEPDEEITSVIEKIKELSGSGVSLVIPKNATLIASVINLRLLEREAKRLKKKVSIITQDKIGRKLAAQVGIPVYRSVTDDKPIIPESSPKPKVDDVIELEEEETKDKIEAEEKSPVPVKHYGQADSGFEKKPINDDRQSQKSQTQSGRTRKFNFKKKLVTLLGLGLVFLIAALWWLFSIFPRATVMLALKSDPLEQTVQIKVDNSATKISDDLTTIPGQTLETKSEKSGNFPATGEKEVGTNSTGKVNLENLLGEAVKLPAGTTFSRDGFAFTSGESVTVPAATVSIDSSGNVNVVGGKASVSVEATAPGDKYNLGTGEFSVSGLSSSQQAKFSASNSSSFTGGSSQILKIVNENDLERAKASLVDQVRNELKKELEDKAAEKTVISDTIEVEVIESNANHNPGDEAESFDLTANVRARTIVFDFSDFEDAIIGQVKQGLPEDRELVVDQKEDKIETRVADSKVGDGILDLVGVLTTKVVAQIDQVDLKNKIAGQTVSESEQILKKVDGIIDAQIDIRPSFREKIPSRHNQIIFEISR